MKITEDYVRKTIEEVAHLVEEVSGLKTNLKDFLVSWDIKNPFASSQYDTGKKEFIFNPRLFWNDDALKLISGHEVFHNAQYSTFPKLEDKTKNPSKHRNNEEKSIIMLIEGDATLIEKILHQKYFKNPLEELYEERPLFRKNSSSIRYSYDINYLKWAKILQNKFDGKRKDINELYTVPIKELDKIFGENQKGGQN